MMPEKILKYLFVINSGAGTNSEELWEQRVRDFFDNRADSFEILLLKKNIQPDEIKKRIAAIAPQNVIAVGGDGTIAMLATILAGSGTPLGILPAGSANGMARELQISETPVEALQVIADANIQPCDLIKINDRYCLHLSDLGLNARLIKYFDEGKLRGKWGYAKVVLKTLVNKQKMELTIRSGGTEAKKEAFMIAFANARTYGTGAVINPGGVIDDGVFEVIIVKKLRFGALLRMFLRPGRFNPKNIEIISCTEAAVTTRKLMHFQVDGEYIGQSKAVSVTIAHQSLQLILPVAKTTGEKK